MSASARPWPRRRFLRRMAGVGAAASLGAPLLAVPARPAVDLDAEPVADRLAGVRPRADWGADRPPIGPLEAEAPEDVRFLIVHHSATPNAYGEGDVPRILRGFFDFHTSERGWHDVAYNFLIDRFGVVWEGREGSLSAPIKGDATGGSQGFALLACWIGDHSDEPPTEAAQEAMVGLLAALALRWGIDPRGEATFRSRGSNLHPEGSEVTTSAIAGHREMSRTACPGDAGQRLVEEVLPARVAAVRDELAARAEPEEDDEPEPAEPTRAPARPEASPTAEAAPTAEASPRSEPGEVARRPEAAATDPPRSSDDGLAAAEAAPPDDDGLGWAGWLAGGVTAAMAAAAGGAIARRRSGGDPDEPVPTWSRPRPPG